MFDRIISFVTRHPKRVIALWAVLTIALAMVASTQGYKVMTDDTPHRDDPSRSRGHAVEECAVDYWALRVTREELERAVDNAGPAADAVRRFLGK